MNLQPQLSHLLSVERWTLLLTAALISLSFLFLGPKGQLGVCLGAGITVLNARLLRVLGTRLQRLFSERPPALGPLLLLLNGKLALLLALIYLSLRYLPVEPMAFILGVSVLPVAILLSAVSRGLLGPPPGPPSPQDPHG